MAFNRCRQGTGWDRQWSLQLFTPKLLAGGGVSAGDAPVVLHSTVQPPQSHGVQTTGLGVLYPVKGECSDHIY